MEAKISDQKDTSEEENSDLRRFCSHEIRRKKSVSFVTSLKTTEPHLHASVLVWTLE